MKTLSAPLALVGLLCLLPVTASAWDFRPSQHQSQAQSQAQSQGQGQVNDQTIAPAQSVRHETTFDRYAPSIAAPALTSGGIGICLGSFSAGVTVPMVGAMFGKTIVDKGCSAARDAMILYNMGHKGAALRVLSGESIKDAMAAEGILPASKSAAVMEPTPVAVQSSAIVEGGR